MINCTLIGCSRLYHSQVTDDLISNVYATALDSYTAASSETIQGRNRGEDVTNVRIRNLKPSLVVNMIGVRRLKASIPGGLSLSTSRLGVRPW